MLLCAPRPDDRYPFSGSGCSRRRQTSDANAVAAGSRRDFWNCTIFRGWQARIRIRFPIFSSSARYATPHCISGLYLNRSSASLWKPARQIQNRGSGRCSGRSPIPPRLRRIRRSSLLWLSQRVEWTSSSTEHKKKMQEASENSF